MKKKFLKFLILCLVIFLNKNLYSDIGISISTDNWNLGTLGAYAVVDSTNIVVTNTGTMWEEVWIAATNSANWNLVKTTPTGLNKFAMRFIGGDVSDFIYLDVNYQMLQQWLAKTAKLNSDVYLRFYGPAATGTPATQTIYVYFQARPPEGFTFNSAGNFYWKDVGAVTNPDTNWSNLPYYEILPSSYWTYMTGTTVGWLTSPGNTTSFIVPYASDFGFIWGDAFSTGWGTVATTGTCPFDSTPYQKTTVAARADIGNIAFPYRFGESNGSYTTETIFFSYATIIGTNLGTSKIFVGKTLSWADCSDNVWTKVAGYSTNKSFHLIGCPYCGWVTNYSNVGVWRIPLANSDSTVVNTVAYSRIVILD